MAILKFNETYKPREDSYLLQKYVKECAKGLVLDMGTGSGIQAITAAKKKSVKRVLAVDISKRAIEECKRKIADDRILNKKIEFKQSDLFEYVPLVKFDIIIFNPPYLPEDVKLKDLTIYGGRKGYETIKRFLDDLSKYLKPDGKVLLLFSSLTHQQRVNEFIDSNLLQYKLLEKKHIFFEDLFVYLIEKSKILIELEKRKLQNMKFFKKGNRGIVYTANYNKKKVAVKIESQESKAFGRIANELKWLKILNKYKIGPRLLFGTNKYIVEEFIEGDLILGYIAKADRNKALSIIRNILEQCYKLDTLNVNKYEMHRPYKHIIFDKSGLPVLLDFERCKYTRDPKNVSQFVQFLTNKRISEILPQKKIIINNDNIRNLARYYKSNKTRASFERIIKAI